MGIPHYNPVKDIDDPNFDALEVFNRFIKFHKDCIKTNKYYYGNRYNDINVFSLSELSDFIAYSEGQDTNPRMRYNINDFNAILKAGQIAKILQLAKIIRTLKSESIHGIYFRINRPHTIKMPLPKYVRFYSGNTHSPDIKVHRVQQA